VATAAGVDIHLEEDIVGVSEDADEDMRLTKVQERGPKLFRMEMVELSVEKSYS